ncbi:MAG TPA: phenylalanine--tRNA ligase subunit beta [Solirubrobacteraceae bacterium]|nr:phenylalanine--tRNA ligase subunit beta [Solirubrobacteraceae bacterium]
MRVPLEWLHEYVVPDLDTAALAERLAMTGTEVERVERHGVTALENFVIGRVLEAGQHPNADRLRVCVVDVGDGTPSQIVCGAPNVAAGQTVAVAKPGAVMPDGTKLGKAKLRGIESNGMILAEDEVAIGTEHDGIMVLERDGLEPGTPLKDVLPIATDVLVLEITPNRPDCLAIYGVAREAHAATGAALRPPPWRDDPGEPGDVAEATVVVECPDLCPRFTARVFEDVKIGPSPLWLKARLTAAGQRPISNVVDITNYAMLLTGQPLHAFDLDRVEGATLTVRRARDGERIDTLDGQTRTLDSDMVLIEDAAGPTSLAGVMGGARSEVAPDTTRVLMEAANWDGANIHHTSLKLGLRSEASSRFEKGIQPEQAIDAQAVSTRLMLDLAGARLVPGTIDVGGEGPPPKTIRLREARVESLLGAPISRARCAKILGALEFTTAETDDGLDVTVPAFRRADVTREADLIEEVARLDGLDKLPVTLPSRHGASGRLTARQRFRRGAVDALAAQGLNEIVGWSFAHPDLADRLRLGPEHPLRRAVTLANPLSTDLSELRTTLLGSLLDVARHNRARGVGNVRLFEAGAVYLPTGRAASGQLPREPYHLGAVLLGRPRPATWRDNKPRTVDFFAVKGVLEGLMDRVHADWHLERATEPFLHPGRSARIIAAGAPVGWIGEVHPLVAAGWDLRDTVAAFELDLDAVPEPATPLYHAVSGFPDVREDIAVVVPEHVTAAQLLALVRHAGGRLLAGAEVFDVYRDPERLGEGNVSLAVRLTYRAGDRTLTDEEVAERRGAIAEAVADQLGGRIRAS